MPRRTELLALIALVALVGCDRRRQMMPPDGADTGVAILDSIPTIEILSPAGTDTLVEGRTHVIRWTASGVQTLDIGAAIGGKDKGHLGIAIPASPDTLVWTVPEGFVSGVGLEASSNARLMFESRDPAGAHAESEPFTIVAQPSIAP
ncbi:MAG TPA: hypothetical protein VFS94_09505 [Gemmatimonadales bacterium]|nr:hypothetical protein [Gemmatimonadales bacterium]